MDGIFFPQKLTPTFIKSQLTIYKLISSEIPFLIMNAKKKKKIELKRIN